MPTGAGPRPRGSMALSSAQEVFSHAYVQAVTAAARCATAKPWPDVVGIDLVVHQDIDGDPPAFANVELQLKSTYQEGTVGDQEVRYRLKKDHYDALRTPAVTWPRILVVVVVPPNIDDWLAQTEEEMRLLRCGYWTSLKGKPAITTDTTTVSIPRENQFTVDALCELLYQARLDEGGEA